MNNKVRVLNTAAIMRVVRIIIFLWYNILTPISIRCISIIHATREQRPNRVFKIVFSHFKYSCDKYRTYIVYLYYVLR